MLECLPPLGAEPGPYLLKMIFMRATDDNGGMVCQDVYLDQGCRPQSGRWVSRTVLDHRDRELFVIRKRWGAQGAASWALFLLKDLSFGSEYT